MGADIVSVLHVSPSANLGLGNTITSPALKNLGTDIYGIWDKIAPKDQFCHIDSEKLIEAATSEATPDGFDDWADWMRRRYL